MKGKLEKFSRKFSGLGPKAIGFCALLELQSEDIFMVDTHRLLFTAQQSTHSVMMEINTSHRFYKHCRCHFVPRNHTLWTIVGQNALAVDVIWPLVSNSIVTAFYKVQ